MWYTTCRYHLASSCECEIALHLAIDCCCGAPCVVSGIVEKQNDTISTLRSICVRNNRNTWIVSLHAFRSNRNVTHTRCQCFLLRFHSTAIIFQQLTNFIDEILSMCRRDENEVKGKCVENFLESYRTALNWESSVRHKHDAHKNLRDELMHIVNIVHNHINMCDYMLQSQLHVR